METPESMDERAREAALACARLLGGQAVGWEDPGGQRRKSTRLFLSDRSVIATRRSSSERAGLEVSVLRRLHAEGAAVPAVLAFDGRWLIQEDLPGERLSRALRSAGKEEAFALQEKALASLDAIHIAARRAGLAPLCFRIGGGPGWIEGLAETPGKLGVFLGLPAPEIDGAAVARILERPLASFVKWDARPPNAVLGPDGEVSWFDWEHCGTRNRLDDIVWFLCDESIIDRPGDELRLMQRWLPRFDEGGYPTGAADYVTTMGALHCAVRLSLQVSDAAREERPADWRESLMGSGPAALSTSGRRLTRRGARWADRSSVLAPLGLWFRAVLERFSPA